MSSETEHSKGITVDPPVVETPKVHRNSAIQDLADWLDERLGAEGYGAPRVFDIFTMFAVTLAFALLFTVLKFLQPALGGDLAPTVASFSAFVTLTGIAQMFLWNGKQPRLASIVAGPVNWFVIGLALLLISQGLKGIPMAVGAVCTAPFGVFAGYLAGAMVAGVFLLADKFRKRFMKEEPAEDQGSEESMWADEVEDSNSGA